MKRWESLIRNIKCGRAAGGAKAPHKPLLTLLILGRAWRGESRIVAFDEVKKPLAELLRQFAPRTVAPPQPELPFWHLQRDGFWIVQEGDDLEPRMGANRPAEREIRKTTGEVSEDLWEMLVRQPEQIPELASVLIESHLEAHDADTLLMAVGLPSQK